MDGASIASLAGTLAAIVVAALAYLRGRYSDNRKANTVDVTTAVSGLQTLAAEHRIEITALRSEVHECEQDKARMKGTFETEVRHLYTQIAELRAELQALRGARG